MVRRTSRFRPHAMRMTQGDDGALLLEAKAQLGKAASRTGDWLHHWADKTPGQTFLAERSGPGWRKISYAETLQQVRAIAAALLSRDMGPETPIMVISGNGIDHGLLALAAQYVGVPLAPVAEQYALVEAAHPRLIEAVRMIAPHMIYAEDARRFGPALSLPDLARTEVVSSHLHGIGGVTRFSDLLTWRHHHLDKVHLGVGPDTVAKILMTSGSTSAPKGVLTTHRMLCVNQVQLAHALPFLSDRPPVLVDWLPWNHVFGGSHNFNMALAHGGTLYIDDGKPTPGLFRRTLENLSLVTGTLSFNVPLGYTMLVSALSKDADLRRRFFADLDLIFYAGASLPQDIWRALEDMALATKGEVPLMTASWGLTETAPACVVQHEPIGHSGVIGVPLPGVTVKLLPLDEDRSEIRVKGPNVMPGYFQNPARTAEAFDDQGFFITGDVMRFADPRDPERGLCFDGRLSEDFKLLSGTWVRAARLRLELLDCLAPLASDLVVTGAGRSEIGVMIFLNRAETTVDNESDGAITDPELLSQIRKRLAHRGEGSSSTHVARAIVLAEPPSMPDGEITAKGNLNFHKILVRRAALLARLYADTDPAVTKV